MPQAKIPTQIWTSGPSGAADAPDDDAPLPLALCWAIWIAFAGGAWALLIALFVL